MTVPLYDAVNAGNIPLSAPAVAGYCDGAFRWPASSWALFPRAVRLRIATSASTDDGHVGDVESGDMTPALAVPWVVRRRAAGMDPAIYCSLSTWPQCRSEFGAQGVSEPRWWVADWNDPTPHLLPGTVATQYRHGLAPGYDLSQADPAWVGEIGSVEEERMLLVAFAGGGWYLLNGSMWVPVGADVDAISAGGVPKVVVSEATFNALAAAAQALQPPGESAPATGTLALALTGTATPAASPSPPIA